MLRSAPAEEPVLLPDVPPVEALAAVVVELLDSLTPTAKTTVLVAPGVGLVVHCHFPAANTQA